MQYSRAQLVADSFMRLINAPSEDEYYGQVFSGDEAHEQLLGVVLVSDWLQLWLYTGEARDQCDGDFGLYMHAVAIIFAEFTLHPALFGVPEMQLVPTLGVTTSENGLIDHSANSFITSQEYPLPASLTLDGFKEASDMANGLRSHYICRFIAPGAAERYRYGTMYPFIEI